MKELARLNKYFFKYRYRLGWGFLFVVLSNLFGVLPPQIVRYAFDLVKDNITYYQLYEGFELQASFYGLFSSILLLFGAVVIALAVIKGIFLFMTRQTIIVMSRLIEYDLRNELYTHYQNLHTAFYKRNRTGDLMSRITEDVNRVRMYFGPAIMYGVNLLTLIVVVVGTMLMINVELTLYVLIPLPLLAGTIYYVNTLIHQRSERIQQQMSQLTSVAQESFSGIRVLKAYTQELAINGFFEQESEEYKRRSLDLARVNAFFMPSITLLIGLSIIITIYIGGLQVIKGELTSGNIAEFVMYVNMLTWPVIAVGWVASIVQRAAASQKRINQFLDEQPKITSPENVSPKKLEGAVAFKQVDFVYPDTGIHALQKVSFSLAKGEKMAIIGRTGSGKSTIADLLVRKYDPQGGSVQMDKTDIRQLHLQSLRDQIGYVPQDVFLFSETIKNNVSFGLSDVTAEQIETALEQAAVKKDIDRLPEKMLTVVGERGVTLSGGQKQRITLARALIKEPQVILLDDCLSAVDAETEQTIINHLNTYLSDKTAIIITHRIFALMNFNKIIVLEEGKLVEEGTHESLLQQKGLYYELFEKQRQEQQGKKPKIVGR